MQQAPRHDTNPGPWRAASLTTQLTAWAAVSLLFLAALATEALGRTATIILDDYAAVLAPGLAALAC